MKLQVRQICGDSAGSTSTSAATDAPEAPEAPESPAKLVGNAEKEEEEEEEEEEKEEEKEKGGATADPADLRTLLESLLPVMASARGFYSNLPDSVCSASDGPFANSTDTDCWNGQRIGT